MDAATELMLVWFAVTDITTLLLSALVVLVVKLLETEFTVARADIAFPETTFETLAAVLEAPDADVLASKIPN